MQVILLEDIPSLGKAGDVVKVADGYGRNYLLPQKKAIQATEKNLKTLEHQKRLIQQKVGKRRTEAERMAQKIENLTCTFYRNVGESGKLFGAITSMDIVTYLKEQGIEVDRKKIHLEEPIKNVGNYNVPIKLHPEITATLRVWVVQQ